MRNKVNTVILNIVLACLGLCTMLPFVWMLLSSFKYNCEIVALSQSLFPRQFTVDNYMGIHKTFNFLRFFFNSIFTTVLVTLLVIYTSTISGYVFAKYEFRGKNLLFSLILSTMMIPWFVTIIPRYSMILQLGWIDSYTALIVPVMISGFGIFMLRQYIRTIPDEVIEAARIDGASEWYIFHRIIFPLSKNAISSIAIFQFLWSWEDYLWPYLVINSDTKQLLAVGLRMFSTQYSTDYGGLFAATTISIIPVIIVYLIFQNRFIEGITSSAVKG